MRFVFGLVALGALASCTTAPPPPAADALGWLSGCYASADGSLRLEWTRGPDGVLRGKQSSWAPLSLSQPMTYQITRAGSASQLVLTFEDGLASLPVGNATVTGRRAQFSGDPSGRAVSMQLDGNLEIRGNVTGGQELWLFQGASAPCPPASGPG
jgi:hypothetical protein